MTVSDTLATSTRAAHDVGLAAWLERGSVANAAWNAYNPINALGLGVARRQRA